MKDTLDHTTCFLKSVIDLEALFTFCPVDGDSLFTLLMTFLEVDRFTPHSDTLHKERE